MKGIKMLGLSDLLMKSIYNLRFDELSISKNFRKLLVWNMAFGKLKQTSEHIGSS
jgi:hypothetical protein